MNKLLSISLAALFLSGCSAQHNRTEYLSAAREVTVKHQLIKIPQSQDNFHLMYGNDPALEQAFNKYVFSGKAPNIITDGFVKFAYNTAQQPIIKANPFQETVVSLEPGEKFTNVSSGDPSRWSYAAAISGSGANLQQNILIKPSLPDISTNMVITTDRRIYNLKLVSTMDAKSTKSVSFWYPDEMIKSINNEVIKQEDDNTISSVPNVSLNNINFDYRISSDGFFRSLPSWKPTRVFDDGTHTYIQFGSDIGNKDMPALFVLNGHSKELVNYRSKPPYFVVDKIFKQAVLIMGVGYDQSKVIITNNSYS